MPCSYTRTVRGVSARRDRAESMAYAVEQIHRPEPQKHDKQKREHQIDKPQALGSLAYAWTYFIVRYAGNLGVEHLHAPRVVEHRYHGKREEDDTHTAYPLHHGVTE